LEGKNLIALASNVCIVLFSAKLIVSGTASLHKKPAEIVAMGGQLAVAELLNLAIPQDTIHA
jgi:hypothetical protein